MKVSTLMDAIELRDDKSYDTVLADLEVAADCSLLHVKTNNLDFPWDEQAERAIASYLRIPKTYLHRCDPEFKAYTVNHWIANSERADTTIEYVSPDGENQLIALQSPDKPVLPLHTVGQIIARTFAPEDDVLMLKRDEKTFHLDIATSHSVEVPPVESIPDRQVGDITRGGVRILATPHSSTSPVVQSYFHRLICTNGMTDLRSEGTIRLKGRTVPELLDELEAAAQRVLGNMQNSLDTYADMATKRVPGNPATFAYRIAEENRLGPRVTERIMGRAGGLPTTGEVSLYDIANIFTETAQSGVSYGTQVKMQDVAGALAFDAETALNRCKACEQSL